MNERVIVVGAGIAGLAAAFRLQQAGFEVVVLECSGPELVGGRMATVYKDGFAVDVGATLLCYEYREMLDLIAAAGLKDHLLPGCDIIGIPRAGRVDRAHTGSRLKLLMGGFLGTFPKSDLIKIGADFLRYRSKIQPDDMSAAAVHDFETVSEYAMRRGLHPETREYLLDPITKGLCLIDQERVSSLAPFVFLNVIFGGKGFFTAEKGVGFLPQALARKLDVEYGARVTSVERERDGKGVTVTWTRPGMSERVETADSCVIAVPPPQAVPLYDAFTAEQRDFLSGIEYARSIHVGIGIDRPTTEKAMLLQTSRIDHPDLVGFVLEHNYHPQRVPTGKGLVQAYIQGSWSDQHWDLDDEKIVDYVMAGTRRLGILPELEEHAIMTQVIRVSPCLAVRRPGDYRAIARFAATLDPYGPVQFAGSDLLGHSTTNSAVCSGQRAARRVLVSLRGAS